MKNDEYLTVSRIWNYYLKQNAAVVEGWMNYKLIDYLQRRNPNVPAVPFKVFPPTDRDRNLTAETKFWMEMREEIPLCDIFLTAKNWKKNKKIIEQYLNVKQDILDITESDRGHDTFIQAMKQTIEPLYQIANNQGYLVWRY